MWVISWFKYQLASMKKITKHLYDPQIFQSAAFLATATFYILKEISSDEYYAPHFQIKWTFSKKYVYLFTH